MERRRSPRIDLNIPITLEVHQWTGEGSFQGQPIKGIVHDLSENGLNISSSIPLAEEMFLVLRFPDEASLPLLNGRIIRCEQMDGQYEYGCLLSGIPVHIRKRLEGYLEAKLNMA